jgi:hypothetical protein
MNLFTAIESLRVEFASKSPRGEYPTRIYLGAEERAELESLFSANISPVFPAEPYPDGSFGGYKGARLFEVKTKTHLAVA